MRPITHSMPKQLVPVANKPILFYAIEAMKAAGITRIGIVVGDTEAEIRGAVGSGERWGVTITYLRQLAPLGLAHAVLISQEFLGKDPFVMYLGDNLILDGIQTFIRAFEVDQPNALILLAESPNPEQFGVVEVCDGEVLGLEEKPSKPKSNLVLVGVYLFDAMVHEAVAAIEPSARGELEITDAIQYLLDHNGRVRSHVITGRWKDTGRLDDLLEANRILLDRIESEILGEVDAASRIEGRVVLEPGARVISSVIRGPAIVGSNTVVTESYIGPFTSIYRGVTFTHSQVEHSIILENTRIVNVPGRITDSLIGKDVVVTSGVDHQRVFRFVLGDHSHVEVP